MDSHRTESLVISPCTQRSLPFVDHTLYDTAAMIRTMGLILGMKPLSRYDANAVPMWRLFHSGADLKALQEQQRIGGMLRDSIFRLLFSVGLELQALVELSEDKEIVAA